MNGHTPMAIEGVAVAAVQLFGDHLDQFQQHLVDQHYANGTVKQYMRCISVLADLMKREKLALDELDLAHASALVAQTGWIDRRRTYATSMAKRFIRFLTEQGVGKPPVPPTAEEIARTALKRDYQGYLRCQRGLGERTVFHAWRFADRVLRFRFGDASGDLSQITSADIIDFLLHLTTRTPPFRDKTPPTHLRNFFTSSRPARWPRIYPWRFRVSRSGTGHGCPGI